MSQNFIIEKLSLKELHKNIFLLAKNLLTQVFEINFSWQKKNIFFSENFLLKEIFYKQLIFFNQKV